MVSFNKLSLIILLFSAWLSQKRLDENMGTWRAVTGMKTNVQVTVHNSLIRFAAFGIAFFQKVRFFPGPATTVYFSKGGVAFHECPTCLFDYCFYGVNQ